MAAKKKVNAPIESITDTIISNITIAKELQQKDLRFVLLQKKDKIPFEKEWQKTNNYMYNDAKLLVHIKAGGNFGVIGGYGNVRILDIDNIEVGKELIKELPPTFTVKTGGGGLHLYYYSEYSTNHVLINEVGEFRAKSYQVVAPGCTHPNGNKYTIVSNISIAKITPEQIKKILKPYLRDSTPTTDATETADKPKDTSRSGREYRECIKLIGQGVSKQEVYKELESFTKWSGSTEQYKEATYTKAKTYIDSQEITVLSTNEFNIRLPQEDVALVRDFVRDSISVLDKCDNLFYRTADDSIQEYRNNKLIKVRPGRMVTLIEKHGTAYVKVWNKWKRKYENHKKSCTEAVCSIFLESSDIRDRLPEIKKVLNCPIPFLINGELVFPRRGYNKEMKLFLSHDAPEIKTDIKLSDAKKELIKIHKEFCFRSENDLFKSILSLLTPFCRGLYNVWNTRTAVFLIFANRERAGKDFLAALRMLLYIGYAIEEPPISTGKGDDNNNELRKKMLSCFMSGKNMMHFSNNKGHINNAIFEQVTTAPVWSDRILGGNSFATFENDMEFSLSGNFGTTCTADLSNRSIEIMLHLAIEKANERNFETPNLHEYVLKNRSHILSCVYALVRNWHKKGCVRSEVPFSSYPEWAGVTGGIMEAAGWENPLKNLSENSVNLDTELEDMITLFELCYEKVPDQWVTKQELKTIIIENSLFLYFGNYDDKSSQNKISGVIQRFVARELSNITMVTENTNVRVARKKLKFTKIKQKEINFDKYLVDKTQNGNLGNLGNLSLRQESDKKIHIGKGTERLPSLPRLPSAKFPTGKDFFDGYYDVAAIAQNLSKKGTFDIREFVESYILKYDKKDFPVSETRAKLRFHNAKKLHDIGEVKKDHYIWGS